MSIRFPLEKNFEKYDANKMCTQEKYDSVFEDFLDTIFDYDSLLTKDDFMQRVREKWWALFHSHNLRLKYKGQHVPYVESDGEENKT